MNNLINDENYAEARNAMHERLIEHMNNTRDLYRGYQWRMRPWRKDFVPDWDNEGYTRQRENEEYEPRQLDYDTGLPMESATRKRSYREGRRGIMESNTIELELRVQKRKRKDKLVLNAWCWLFMAAAVIFYILFQGYPIVCSIVYSLLDWSGLTRTARFVGLSNYKELLTDKLFWNAF